MKYTSLLLALSMVFVLSSCFQKPLDVEDDSSNTGTSVVNEEDTNIQEDNTTEDESSNTGTSVEDEENENNDIQVEASGSVNTENEEQEEVVIEEIEAELEELFSDLLGEDEQK